MIVYKIIKTEYHDSEGYYPPHCTVFRRKEEAEEYFRLQIENNLNVIFSETLTIEEIEEWQDENKEELPFRYFFDCEELFLEALCPHCKTELKPSATEDYKYFCQECEEDFFSFEAKEK